MVLVFLRGGLSVAHATPDIRCYILRRSLRDIDAGRSLVDAAERKEDSGLHRIRRCHAAFAVEKLVGYVSINTRL